jgi:hypothetical protein
MLCFHLMTIIAFERDAHERVPHKRLDPEEALGDRSSVQLLVLIGKWRRRLGIAYEALRRRLGGAKEALRRHLGTPDA